nr:hypothetical protein [Thiocystis minor]
MTITLADLLKDSAYKLGQFKLEQIATLEASINLKDSGNKPPPYLTCLVRGQQIKLTPEEAVWHSTSWWYATISATPPAGWPSSTKSASGMKRSAPTSVVSSTRTNPQPLTSAQNTGRMNPDP